MSSELAYALRNSEDLDGGKDSPHQYPDVSNPPVADGETVPYFYDALSSNETDTAYPQPSSGTLSSPSLGLPMMDFGEKFQFEAEVSHISATGHYQGMSGPYVSSVGQYAPESGFRGSDEQGRDNHLHGMGFARSPDAYSSSYTPDTSVIALESFHSYT
jgi:hypothetical protein